MNVRGLGNRIKRKAVFQYLNDKLLDITFMQEVHCNKKLAKMWQQESGKSWCVSSGTSNARGCAIMVNSRKIKILKQVCNHEGRYVIANVKVEDSKYTLCNLYAPNLDSPEFFTRVFKQVERMACENIVIGGDFNLVLHKKDRSSGLENNPKATEVVKLFMEEYQLTDVWRMRNEAKKGYTWFKKNSGLKSASRLDFFLVNCGLASKVTNADIAATVRSDHCLISLNIIDNSVQCGPGIWRINDSLLDDLGFCKEIKMVIQKAIIDSGAAGMCPISPLEFIKKQCRNKAMQLSKDRSKCKSHLLQNLNKLRLELMREEEEKRVSHEETLSSIVEKIKFLKEEKVKGAIFRSRCNWVDHSEKMSKYFFALEKRRYNNKSMFSVILDDGTVCTQQKEILQEQWRFYQYLYTKNPEIKFSLQNTSGIMLTQVQKDSLDSPILLDEIKSALFSMKIGTVCGCDGLSVLFYKKFYEDLSEPMWTMLQEVMQSGSFGLSGRKGVITLILKGSKDQRYIKNMRPITLLNTDFKIFAKALATRLKSVLPDLIGPQQTGFMTGRNIQENILTTVDIISHVYQAGKRAVIVSINYEKCFDRLEHESIFETMKYFNFGDKFVQWSRVIFNDLCICTQNAGYTSEFFSKTRGCNQGCMYSPFCFILCGELLVHLIKKNPFIKGVKVGKSEVENVISQFTDDTALFLIYSEQCINATLTTLTIFEGNTGLKISYDKTCIYRIGSLKDTDVRCYTTKPIQWSDGDIEMLGITITNGPHQTNKDYEKCLEKMRNVSNLWYNRNLSINGKVLLINTLMGSLFVYPMSVLPPMSPSQVKTFYEIVSHFLWKGKRAKIPLQVLQNPRELGGLKLVNVELKQQALYTNWVKRIITLPQKWAYVYETLAPVVKSLIWECNLREVDLQGGSSYMNLWSSILKTWTNIHYYVPHTKQQVESQILWFNSHIRISGRPLEPTNTTFSDYP